jgi:hypothetical protein
LDVGSLFSSLMVIVVASSWDMSKALKERHESARLAPRRSEPHYNFC